MAKSPTRAARTDKKPAARSAKSTDVEVVEESGGLDFDAGVAIVSALLLLSALIMLDMEMGGMGKGMFFK
jgi:hypothetical protein